MAFGFCFSKPQVWLRYLGKMSNIKKSQYLIEGLYSYAKWDAYPITDGHILIISKEHISNYFDLSENVQNDMMKLVAKAKKLLDLKYGTSDYNIGINCGYFAGQTIDHVHIHVIPRCKGDINDPRGGVRWVLPEKANYWDE